MEQTQEVSITSLISKEFLESHLKKKVLSFSIEDGTKPGDNFNSVLYSISVKVEKNPDDEQVTYHHLLLKCYPSHPSRQKFLNKANLFYKELQFYLAIAMNLVHFQEELVGLLPEQIIPLAIPPCHGGKAVDYSEIILDEKKIYSPLDNYILMTDLRKSSPPFQMPDSKVGLNAEEMKLAFFELATTHALSWAYKEKAKLNLLESYPFLRKSTNPEKQKMWMGILAENADMAVKAIDSALGPGNNLSEAIAKFLDEAETTFQYYSEQDEASERILWGKVRRNEETEEDLPIWRVLCHGDCWTNNLLFQYDPVTTLPQRVALIDFPQAKLGCPTFDLACLVYTSTRREFRQVHLKSCLELYQNRFIEVCSLLKVKTLPALFSVEVLLKKFHVSKLVGFLITLLSLPANLIDKNEDANLEKMDNDSTMADLFQQATSSGGRGELYKEWILELTEELHEEGVI